MLTKLKIACKLAITLLFISSTFMVSNCSLLNGLVGAAKTATSSLTTTTTATILAPTAPTGVTATAIGSTEIDIAWTAVTGADTYNVYRSTTSGLGILGTLISGVTGSAYQDLSLTPGTTYYYVVTAVNTAGESAASSEVAALLPPSAPVASLAGSFYLADTISWSAVTGATSYNIYWGTATGVTTTINAGSATGVTNPYNFAPVAGAGTYYVVVTAANAGGESLISNEVTAIIGTGGNLASPVVTATATSTSTIDVSWAAVPGATSYTIYYDTASTVSSSVYASTTSGVDTNPNTINTLNIGTPYYFVVTATGAAPTSADSTVVSATPAPYISVQALVKAADGTAINEQLVLQDGNPGPNLTATSNPAVTAITLNGIAAFDNTASSGKYVWDSNHANGVTIANSAAVTVSVTVGGITYTATATQYASYPTITTPSDLTLPWDSAVDNSLTWTSGSATSISQFIVGISPDFTTWTFGQVSGGPYIYANSINSVTVPAFTLSSATAYFLIVGIMDNPSLAAPIPGALPGSTLSVGAGNVVPFTTN